MLGLNWRPAVTAHAVDAEESTASRDAGWAELWSVDGETRYGRGHLMIWASEATASAGEDEPTPVREQSAQPAGGEVVDLRAELRSFTPDTDPPAGGTEVMVRPEHGQDSYVVLLRDVDDSGEKAVVHLDWPDDQLPASLTEVGGA